MIVNLRKRLFEALLGSEIQHFNECLPAAERGPDGGMEPESGGG